MGYLAYTSSPVTNTLNGTIQPNGPSQGAISNAGNILGGVAGTEAGLLAATPTTAAGQTAVAPQAMTTSPVVAGQAGQGSYLPQTQGLVDTLSGQVAGTGPSLAGNLLNQGEQQQVANQMSVLGSQRGVGTPGAARLAADQSAAGINTLDQNAANARVQEQLAAEGLLGSTLGNAATTQAGIDTSNAGQTTTANAATAANAKDLAISNLSAQLSQEGYSDDMIKALLQGQTTTGNDLLTGGNAGNAVTVTGNTATNTGNLAEQTGVAGAIDKGINTGASVASSALGGGSIMSDKNVKEDKAPAEDDIKDFLDHLSAYSYRYKDEVAGKPGAPEGQHTGVLAQDLQKSKVGAQAVKPDADGHLTVDHGQLTGSILAALAYLNDKQDGSQKAPEADPTKSEEDKKKKGKS